MEKLSEFRINDYISRCKMVSALTESGYTVTVKTKEKYIYPPNQVDYFVVIVGEPELPRDLYNIAT